jgi:hypothetical protein
MAGTLFGKRINSKPKKIRQMFFLFLEITQNAFLNQTTQCRYQRQIVLLSGTVSRQPGAKRMRNARCVATGDTPFFL